MSLKTESEHLSIPMGEFITFPKGWKNIPAYALLEVQAGQGIQVYDVSVVFTARFGGMRWLMYQHWILASIGFTGAFWGVELLLAGMAWLLMQSWFGKDEVNEKGGKVEEQGFEDGHEKIKEERETDEEPDLSDTPRTFPTAWRQAPLRYEPKVKDEEEYVLDDTEIQPLGAQADDEDEYEEEEGAGCARGRDIDSGIGTSFSEGAERDGVTRRRSKGGRAS
ncbi:hypothetical protein LOCC1_G008925 [Lachnellula occidentalis]|uniref:Seipin n=1 Tax=Lachnellula occidentalis TaxID=215460 RepID=A0A8H8R9T3_9HELO|nr:hypothetical protein LOCC1_G008925 [Lachnellula occidentalis]